MNSPHCLSHHFVTEAYNNAWANHRLLKACGALSQEEFVAPRAGFFPSIKATLNHILTVDWYYLEIFQRSLAGLPPHGSPGRFFEPEEPFETCAALSREQHAADRRLIALCESLTDERMDDVILMPNRKGPLRDRVRRILAHLFQHDIHHPRPGARDALRHQRETPAARRILLHRRGAAARTRLRRARLHRSRHLGRARPPSRLKTGDRPQFPSGGK